jgi:chemotaxis-related protein WspD
MSRSIRDSRRRPAEDSARIAFPGASSGPAKDNAKDGANKPSAASSNDRAEEPEGSAPEGSCWETIGVISGGRGICPELKRFTHCRNCPVFTRAGRALLERELPPGYQEEAAEALAVEKIEEPPGAESLVIFRIEREWLALPTRLLSEVVDPEKFHSLPHRKNPVLLGVVNVHGDIQLCVSLRALLDIEEAPSAQRDRRPANHRRMMVIGEPGAQWVFPADEILGIDRVRPQLYRRAPVTVAKAGSAYTRAIFSWPLRKKGAAAESVNVALLDADLILYSLIRNVQ